MIRELDHRTTDGIDVALLWDTEAAKVLVSVMDGRQATSLQFDVAASDALDAFHHPYAYAARGRTNTVAATGCP